MPADGNNPFAGIIRSGNRAAAFVSERLSGGRTERTARLLLLIITALILAFIISPRRQFSTARYQTGDIATASIKAGQDYLLEDPSLTEKKRKEAEAAAPLVYGFDSVAANSLCERLQRALQQEGANSSGSDTFAAITRILGVEISRREAALLGRLRWEKAESEIRRVAATIYVRSIVADQHLFTNDAIHGIQVVDTASGETVPPDRWSSAIELSEAQRLLEKTRLRWEGKPEDREILKGLLAKLLQPNLSFDREGTERKRREAREGVRPVLLQVKRGEMIVREGERIREDQAQKLKMIYESGKGMNGFLLFLGLFALALITFSFTYRFARKNIRKFNPSNKDLLLLGYVTIGHFLILKVSLIISTAMGGVFPSIHTSDYYFLFPFALGAMLVRIVLNSEVALVYCVVCAILTGIMFENNLMVVIYSLMGGVVGAHGVRHCTDRGTLYSAGLKVSVVNVALTLSFQIINDSFLSMQTLVCAAFAVGSGLIAAALATATIPVVESIFQYTTNIKLLELANLNSPILRELMIKAPGTYHHSVLVGNMVEAAAETINANPLLARVAAYYHDIGKISKPLYFIENVGDGENRHDRLSPSMSALILISHVKEGVELAKENRLGQPIVDIIRQSHGTALITFFYQKAKAQAGEGKIEEQEFRYPGPKPQTREAGLVMLADCVEAASRTLTDPTPARIQGMVQKIINNIFIDGQLDECELTLKNLHEIAKSFNRILSGIYHHRIDYPEPAYKEKTPGGKKSGEDNGREPAKGPQDTGGVPAKGSGEDIRRLGIVR